MRPRRVAAKPGDLDVDLIGRRHDRAGADGETSRPECPGRLHAVDLLDAETVHQAVLDHRGGARAALFGRLEDHDRIAGEIARLGEIAGGAQQHRGVAVMAAGVHLARGLGGIRQIGRLLDRQRIHVGAQPDHLDVALAGGLRALDDADDAGPAEAGRDLVAAEFPQPVRHECRSAVDVVQQFGMLMDIAAPGLNIGLKIGDAVDDGHGDSWFRFECLPCLACSDALHPTLCRRGLSNPSELPTEAVSPARPSWCFSRCGLRPGRRCAVQVWKQQHQRKRERPDNRSDPSPNFEAALRRSASRPTR